MDITILGIESSCDDTSAAVIRNRTLLSNVIASQAVHQKYGGVIPELASRAHQQNIIPVVDTALKEAGVTSGYDSTTESALAKLFYLMGISEDNSRVKEMLEVDLRGEMSK